MATVPINAPPLTAPDWPAIAEDILCPLCNYNLRGLVEPRCPECGFRFEWPALLDPNRRKHPYLFEHHPEANIWSYFKTVRGACKPRTFWTSLHPVQPSRLRRLLFFWCIGALALFLLLTGDLIIRVCAGAIPSVSVYNAVTGRAIGQSSPLTWGGSTFVSGSLWISATHPIFEFTAALLPLTWHALTIASLLIFRQTMRRVRVRNAHIMRCVIYAGDPSMWAVCAAGLALCSAGYFVLGTEDWGMVRLATFEIWIAAYVWTIYRLRIAFQCYLQFDRPLWTVLASQIIVFLLVLNVQMIRVWF